METDTCDVSIGVIIMYQGKHIAYLSNGLSLHHQAMSLYEKELLALVMDVSRWGQYLIGRHFIVRTYQRALKFQLK